MGRKLLLINLLMVAAIVLLAQQLLASWSAFQNDPKVVQPPTTAPPEGSAGLVQERSTPLGEFMVITEQNLFSKNRGNEAIDMEPEEEEQPPEFSVAPQLISVSTIRDERQAVLKIATGRRGRNSENRIVKMSDDIGGYKVSEIGRDFLILRWKDYEQMIQLSRETASNTRSGRSAGAVKIITVGSAAASDETERSVQVGAVGSQQQADGRRGGQATLGGAAGQRNLTGRNNNNQNPRAGVPGTVGSGTRRPPVRQNPPE